LRPRLCLEFHRGGRVVRLIPILLLGVLPALSPAQEKPCVFAGVDRVVAVGDLHGAYGRFVEILKGMRIVDDDLRWIGGKTHLVQMGDIMDRGDRPRDIFDLVRRLEEESREAGGAVHMLIGNHEEMNILGISFEVPGMVSAEQFKSFLTEKTRAKKEREFRFEAGPDGDTSRLWEKFAHENKSAQREYTREFNEKYGRWIAAHNTLIKINDVAFVHGGLNEALSVESCESFNSRISTALTRYIRDETWTEGVLYQPLGPLWFRDQATKDEDTIREETDRILANLGAKALVIGHTPTPAALGRGNFSRLGGKIWLIDTGIWMSRGGRMSALLIENGLIKLTPGKLDEHRGER